MKVEGKVCIVTGGASGIGAALCEALGESSAKTVIAVDVNAAGAEAVCETLQGQFPKTRFVGRSCDVRKEENIRELADWAKTTLGESGIDIFVANAGIIGPLGGPEVLDDAAWQNIIAVNVLQAVYAAKVLLPDMLAKGEGGFIVTASAAGLLSQIGAIGYAVTKRAAVAAAEYLAIMYGGQGIAVSCLCPQAVRTNMIAHTKGGGVAGVDGVLEPLQVARLTVAEFEAGSFLVLPHINVGKYMKRKAENVDVWIKGMQRLATRTEGGVSAPPSRLPAKL